MPTDRIKISVFGDKELVAKLKRIGLDARSGMLDTAAQAGAEVIRTQAAMNAPYKLGNLRRSIHTLKIDSSGSTVWYEVGSNLNYAAIQEFGGTIKAKKGRLLVFEIDGQLIFTKQVEIPAQPYLRPAFDEKKVEAIATVGRVFERLVIMRHVS